MLESLDFTDKKDIIRALITKVRATQEEVIIWGQLPVLAKAEVGFEPKHRYRYCVTQQPFELKLTMPPTDRGGRGYSDEYVAELVKELV